MLKLSMRIKKFNYTNYQYEISVSKISAKEGDILIKIL